MCEKLKYCKIIIRDGIATAVYRWESSPVSGKDTLDDDVSTWTNKEIREVMAQIVGIEDEDINKIEIIWD